MYLKSISEGNQAELSFESIAENKGFYILPSTYLQNMHCHIDYFLYRGKDKYSVDVKAQKRISRRNQSYNNNYIWIELQNVNGFNGWLYGYADLIAFETPFSYIVVKRYDLINLVENKLNRPDNYYQNQMKFVNHSSKALYSFYQRKNRKDIITMIMEKDLKTINHKIWKK